MIAPCKNCTDRVVGCHSTCEKYLAFQKERELVREKKYKDYCLTSAIIESKLRCVK